MLSFPEGFFETEEREGFVVDSTMKSVWAAELEVLAAIADICARHQIPWFADWGTLLGAVRHQGFIPWDDDIDISMIREDFQRFLEVAPSELPEGWVIYSSMCGEGQSEYWISVMNSRYISVEPNRLREFHGCPFIVGVDIFPMDYIPRDEHEYEMEKAIFMLIWKAVQLDKTTEMTDFDRTQLEEAVAYLEEMCNIKFNEEESLTTQLWRLGHQLCASYTEEEGDYLASYLSYTKNNRVIFDKHWFDEIIYLPFESVEMPCPAGYVGVLLAEFGENYMIPYQGYTTHEYPYYNKQLEQLRDIVKDMEEKAENDGKNNA